MCLNNVLFFVRGGGGLSQMRAHYLNDPSVKLTMISSFKVNNK
jgi:hypothetical protein